MDEWWKTPASLVPPPAVDPAIYGIDASDVGLDPHESAHENGAPSASPGLSGSERIAQMLTRTDIEGGLDEYIGLSSGASAQSRGSEPTRKDHVMAADGHRAHAMQNQLLIAARNLEALVDEIDATITAASTKPDERGVDGYVQQLHAIVARGEAERGKIALVTKEKFADRAVIDGVEHVDRAANQFRHAIERAKAFARRHGGTFDEDKHNANGELNDVHRLEHVLGVTGIETSHVKKVGAKESDLQSDSFDESLAGIDRSTQALVLAMRETDAKTAMASVLPGLLSNVRMLEASMTGIKTTSAHRRQAADIRNAMKQAMLDASGVKLDKDPTLALADVNVRAAISSVDKLPRAKK
ncbi:MAG: hypothetical protein AB7T06_08185 [Kofleriaceae bacterium]